MKSPEIFSQEFFEVLRTYPRRPGELILVENFRIPAFHTIADMRVYIDSSVKYALAQQEYMYIPSQSSESEICLLDITHGYKKYDDNMVDELSYTYDSDTEAIIPTVVKTFDIENLKYKFELGEVVVDTKTGKRWIVSFVYTPYRGGNMYTDAFYSQQRIIHPNDFFFYKLRLKRGKKETVLPESFLKSAINKKVIHYGNE